MRTHDPLRKLCEQIVALHDKHGTVLTVHVVEMADLLRREEGMLHDPNWQEYLKTLYALREGGHVSMDGMSAMIDAGLRLQRAELENCGSCHGSGSQGEHGCTDCLGTGVDPRSALGRK